MLAGSGSVYSQTVAPVRPVGPVAYYDTATWYYDARTGSYYAPAARYYEAAPRLVPAVPPTAHPGVVDRMEIVRRGDTSNVVGTVIGGIVDGAAIGNGFHRRTRSDETFRISVRLDNGAYRTMDLASIFDLHTGERVWLDGNTLFRG
jgi:hypothetical protein